MERAKFDHLQAVARHGRRAARRTAIGAQIEQRDVVTIDGMEHAALLFDVGQAVAQKLLD